MSLAIVNNSSHLVDFAETSRLEQNDLEVEEILNEIGFFANDDMGSGFLESDPVHVMSVSMPPVFAPVSPEHSSSEAGDRTPSDSTIVSSSSFENMQNFSVPNPIATYSSAPAPIMPQTSPSELKKSKAPKAVKTTTKKDTTMSRKRKLSETTSTPKPKASTPASAKSGSRDEELTDEQLEERRQRNREHAKRSRQRKKSLTSTLRQTVDEITAENAKLREQIYASIGATKAESILEARREKARSQFMDGLQDQNNRVLDDSTVNFLRDLRNNIPSTSASAPKKQRTC